MRGNILTHVSGVLIVLLLEALPTTSSSEICRLDGSVSRHVAFKVVQTVGLSPSVDEVWLRVPMAQDHFAQLYSQTGTQTLCTYEPDCCWIEDPHGYYLWAGCKVPPGTDSIKMMIRYEADILVIFTGVEGGLMACPGCAWTGPTQNCQSDDPAIVALGEWALGQSSEGWGASNWDIAEMIADTVKSEVEKDPGVDWKDASTTWSTGRGTCEGIANVIIAALRSLDIPAGFVAAGVVDGTENVASNCVVMNLPTYGHAFFQTWPSYQGYEWVLSDQVSTLEWVESDRVVLCTHIDSDYCAFKCLVYDDFGTPVDADIHYRWVAIAGEGGGSGSLFQTDYFDVGNLSWYGAPVAEYAGAPGDVKESKVGVGTDGLYDVCGRRILDPGNLESGIYFERKNGGTVKRVLIR